MRTKVALLLCVVLLGSTFAASSSSAHHVNSLGSRYWTLPFPPSDLQNDRLITGVLEVTNKSSGKVRARCVVIAHDAQHEVVARQRREVTVPARGKATVDVRMPYGASGWRLVDHLHTTHCHSSGSPPMPALTRSAPDPQIGSHPFLTILCRFGDRPQEPHPRAWFEELMGSGPGGVADYLDEVSWGRFDAGDGDVTGWHGLPRSYDYYKTRLPEAQADCIAQADQALDMSSYEGVVLLFNGELGASAGRAYFKVDGRWRFLSLARAGSATDDPALGSFEDQAIVVHELIHAIGVHFHSGLGSSTSSGWDVMSNPGWGCTTSAEEHGCLAQHPIAYFREVAGWIPEADSFVADAGLQEVTLHPLEGPLPSAGHVWAKVQTGTSSKAFLTAELRRRQGYDSGLPGEGVVIHLVDLRPVRFGLLPTMAARVQDPDGDGDPNDEGSIWTVGETYEHSSGVTITVKSENPDGSVTLEIFRP